MAFCGAARLVPVRLGAERVGEKFDEGPRLRRQKAPMRVNRVDGHVGVEGIARTERNQGAVLELPPNVPGGLERYAEPRDRPFLEHLPVVAGVAPRYAHRSGLAAGAFVLTGHAEVAGGEAVVAGEVARRARRAEAPQIAGARAYDAPVRRKLARGERGIGERRDADGEIEAFLDDVDVPVRKAQGELNVRITGGEARHERRDVLVAERGGQRDLQRAARLDLARADGGIRLLYLGEQARAGVVIGRALVGEVKAAGGAVDKAHAEPRFQRGQSPADDRRRQAQLAGSSGKAARTDDPREHRHFTS